MCTHVHTCIHQSAAKITIHEMHAFVHKNKPKSTDMKVSTCKSRIVFKSNDWSLTVKCVLQFLHVYIYIYMHSPHQLIFPRFC